MGNSKSKQAKLKRKADADTSAIFKAAASHSPDALRALLSHTKGSPSAIVNASNADFETPLFVVWSPEVAALLLQHGADPHARNLRNETPLHRAAQKYDAEVVRILLDHGADVNATGSYGRTPLHGVRYPEIATALLERGADANAPAQFEITPLGTALTSDKPSVAKVLVDGGADVKYVNSRGDVILSSIGVATPLEVVELLVGLGAPVDVADGANVFATPLSQAAGSHRPDILRFLLDRGASVDQCASMDGTPLATAARFDNVESVRLLLERGADVHGDASRKKMPLLAAAANGNIEVMAELLAHGATFQSPPKSEAQQRTTRATGTRPALAAVLELIIANYSTCIPSGYSTRGCAESWLTKMEKTKTHDAAEVTKSLVTHLRSMTKELDTRVVMETYKKVGEFGQLVLRVWAWMCTYEAKSIAERVVDADATLAEFAALHRAVYMLQAVFDSEKAENLNYRALEATLHQNWSGRLRYNRETREELTTFLAAELRGCVDEADPRGVWRRVLVVALGLQILHRQGIAHGSLGVWSDDPLLTKTVAPEERQQPQDSARATSPDAPLATSQPQVPIQTPTPSCAADVYVFGKGIVRVLTGGKPWGRVSQDVVRVLNDAGQLPRRPEHVGVAQWRLLEGMQVADPGRRVEIAHVVAEVRKFVCDDDAGGVGEGDKEAPAEVAP